jgi:hypothetical protein
MYFINGYSIPNKATVENNMAILEIEEVNPISVALVSLTATNQKTPLIIATNTENSEKFKPDLGKNNDNYLSKH